MKKKYDNDEITQALEKLAASSDAKKELANSIQYRNEPMGLGYIIYILGILALVPYFTTIIQTETQYASHLPLLWIGIFFIGFARSRMDKIKLNRALIELIMDTARHSDD